jgi:8-oxo-dGTP pyrophosphatase MutT (NUDIX family)
MGPSFTLDEAMRARVVRHLAAHPRRALVKPELKAAAVALVLMADARGEACFLLTRRVHDLNHHGGQFALPGGRLDAGEGPLDAALRELAEEVGVTRQAQHVLGMLDDLVTRSGFLITPVVLWAEGAHTLTPNPREVASVYRVPVRDLYRPEVPVLEVSPDGEGPLLSLPLVGTYVHSPTAAILFQMREVAFEGRDTRVDHYGQPRFAWK